jgi:ABC-type uncharacterized transport system auxiliary subunit
MKTIRILTPFIFLLLVGCSSAKPVTTSYYMLEFPHGVELRDTFNTLPFSLEILEADIHPAFGSMQIAMREQTNQIKYFSNHKWANRPSQSITLIVATFFDRSMVFKKSATRFWDIVPQYKLKTIVHQLEIVSEGRRFEAHLNIEFQIVETNTAAVVVTHAADKFIPLEKRELNAFADVVSKMVFDELVLFCNVITDTLK